MDVQIFLHSYLFMNHPLLSVILSPSPLVILSRRRRISRKVSSAKNLRPFAIAQGDIVRLYLFSMPMTYQPSGGSSWVSTVRCIILSSGYDRFRWSTSTFSNLFYLFR